MRDYNFFAMLSRMKYINRWGLMRNSISENIAEHSLETAFIAHGLAVIGNTYFGKHIDAQRVAVLAMFHDTTEIITGDMPTPVKYYESGIKESYKNVEKKAGHKLLGALPLKMREEYDGLINQDSTELYRYVKAADKISAYIKCTEEKQMGNSDFESARQATLDAVMDMDMPEVAYFMENFMPAYSFTLDQLTEGKDISAN